MQYDDLSCERFLSRLGEYVDGSLTAADARACERHLAGCADCRRYRSDYEAAIELARDALGGGDSATGERFPDDLARSILSRVRRSN